MVDTLGGFASVAKCLVDSFYISGLLLLSYLAAFSAEVFLELMMLFNHQVQPPSLLARKSLLIVQKLLGV